MEKWKVLSQYPAYEISDKGNMRNIEKGFNLKPNKTNKGYLRVNLYDKDGKRKWRFVHRLVAQAFIPNPENKSEVNHINFIPFDNRVENLEWCTRQENVKHTVNAGRHKYIDMSIKVVRIHPYTHERVYYNSIKECIEKNQISRYSLVNYLKQDKLNIKNKKTHKGYYYCKV